MARVDLVCDNSGVTRIPVWSSQVLPVTISNQPPSTPSGTCDSDSIRQKGGFSYGLD